MTTKNGYQQLFETKSNRSVVHFPNVFNTSKTDTFETNNKNS